MPTPNPPNSDCLIAGTLPPTLSLPDMEAQLNAVLVEYQRLEAMRQSELSGLEGCAGDETARPGIQTSFWLVGLAAALKSTGSGH